MATQVVLIVAPWRNVIDDAPFTLLPEVTPAASLDTLSSLNFFVQWAMASPYALTALSCNTNNTLTGTHEIPTPAPFLGYDELVGTGTLYTSEVTVGEFITIGGETREVATIVDDTNLTVTNVFPQNGFTGAAGPGLHGTTGTWFWAQRINAGCAFLRGRFHIGMTTAIGDETPNGITAYSSSSGITANDRIAIEVAEPGTIPYPPGFTPVKVLASDAYDGSPAAPVDRLYEVYVRALDQLGIAAATAPYTEGFSGAGFHGMGALWTGVKDMSTL